MFTKCANSYALMHHWKKLEVDLTQDRSRQLQDIGPYHLPLLPQCRVTAFVHLKFQ